MKTRAALFHAAGRPLEVVEIDLEEPRPDEVVVRMHAVGICGTDLHQVKGEFRRPTPNTHQSWADIISLSRTASRGAWPPMSLLKYARTFRPDRCSCASHSAHGRSSSSP